MNKWYEWGFYTKFILNAIKNNQGNNETCSIFFKIVIDNKR